MATLKDVARLAKVDPSTASRVLRGDPRQAVRTETKKRIFNAARSLRYRPNALARGLRTRRTETIGLITQSLDNIGFSQVAHGIQAEAAAAGQLVTVVELDALRWTAEERTEHCARLITDGRVDGLIVASATLDDHFIAELVERDLPVVLVNRRTVRPNGSVVVDDTAGAEMAVRHLIDLGHRRIGFIGLDAATDTARRREEGYRRTMNGRDLPIDARWVVSASPTEAGGHGAVAQLLGLPPSVRPSAVFVASLQGAIGVLAGIREAGQTVPGDISIIAFNDHPLAAHLSPPLTTVRMATYRMGQEAVRMLLRAVNGEPVRDLMLEDEPEVVVRSSTGPPAQ